jgi:PAS domain S-box-containing protein
MHSLNIENEEERDKFRGLSEAAFESIFLSENGICIEQNKAAEMLFGYTSDEAIGKPATDWIIPEDREMVNEKMLSCYEEPYESTALKKDGTTFPCSLHGKMMQYKGQIVRVTSLRDITINKEINDTLRDSYLFTENLLNTANVMIVGLDNNSKVNIFNKSAEKLTGYSKDEVIGKNWLTEIPILPKDSIVQVSNVLKTLLTEEDESVSVNENPIVTRHGEIRYILWQNNEVRKKNKVTGTISFGLDITERKIYEDGLIKSKEKAEESDKLKMAFLSNMSHDLRTPINSIIGFSELLKDDNINEVEKINFLDIIIQNGDILTNLINDIIDITKIDAGTLTVQKTEIELNKLLLELKTQYSKLNKNKIKIEIDINLNHNVYLLTDKFRLKQILMNLMGNALKFTKKGTIKFGYHLLNPNTLRIYVKDTGIGISKDDLKVVFERFSQFGRPGSKDKGAGLGLPISKSLCKILGYSPLMVNSVVDKGSDFSFDIPYILKNDKYPIKKENYDDLNLNLNLENHNVLIVEDDDNIKFILKLFLKNTKGNIFDDDGRNVMNIIKKNEIDTVLLDLGLGNIDGYNLLKEIKKYNKNIIVIIQSAYAISEFKQKAFDLGADDFLTKPVAKSQLFDSINNLI